MKIAMIVGGFPTLENPSRCIFNYRAAHELGKKSDLVVIFFRMWRPRRRILSTEKHDNFSLITISLLGHPRFPKWNYFVFKYIGGWMLKRIVRGCEIIHSVGGSFVGVIASHYSKSFGIKHVSQLIGSDINSALPVEKDFSHIRGWENWIDGISANSKAISDQFEKVYPNLGIPCLVNYRGVDLDAFHPKRKNSGIQLLYIGGLPDYPNLPFRENTKGGLSLMEIWSELDDGNDLSQIKLLFGGPGTDDNRVMTWKAALHQPESVEIIGLCEPAEIEKFMSESHIVLIPSKEEGTPNACFEAMASGCAVYGSNVGGIPELIDDKVSGRILAHDVNEQWVSALVEVFENTESIQKMGMLARSKAETEYSSKLFSVRLIDFYIKLINNEI